MSYDRVRRSYIIYLNIFVTMAVISFVQDSYPTGIIINIISSLYVCKYDSKELNASAQGLL